jgi:hypothetical protein
LALMLTHHVTACWMVGWLRMWNRKGWSFWRKPSSGMWPRVAVVRTDV